MARTFTVKTRLEAEDAASPTIAGVENRLDSLERTALASSEGLGVLAASVAGTVAALKVLISASAEQEDALQRLDSALRLKGAESFAVALREQGDALQQSTRFTDDAINSAQALIATYGVSADQIGLATQAAADLAARLGIDLETAARQVAGTVNGFTRGLDKVVPALKGMSDEALRAGEGIRAVSESMGGGALEAAQTLAGQWDRLTNAMGELVEKGGDLFVQNDLVRNGLEGLILTVQSLSGSTAQSAAAVKDYGDSFANLVAQQEAAIRTVTTLAEIQDRATRIMSENATAQARAAQIAAELGLTLERDVIAKREREAELLRELADLERQGIDVRLATTETIEDEGEALSTVNLERQAGIGLIQSETAAQGQLARALQFTGQMYDYSRRMQGNDAAVQQALDAGGRLVNAGDGTRGGRVTLPGGGSRLLHPTSFGRFGG